MKRCKIWGYGPHPTPCGGCGSTEEGGAGEAVDTAGEDTGGGVEIGGGAGEDAGDDDGTDEGAVFFPRRLAACPLLPLSDARRPEDSGGGGSMAAGLCPSGSDGVGCEKLGGRGTGRWSGARARWQRRGKVGARRGKMAKGAGGGACARDLRR